jgi:O-antigen ligase
VLAKSATLAGEVQPWRPIAMVPSLAWNALQSLIIPVTIVTLFSALHSDERARTYPLLLVVILASAFVGLAQFSGVQVNNPLIDQVGSVSGMLANRNHFALMLACGCALMPAWAFKSPRLLGWRVALSATFLLFLMLLILATGSRTGMVMGVVAILIGWATVRGDIRRNTRSLPRWFVPVAIGALVVVIAGLVAISIGADRAVSVNRLMELSPEEDLRRKALPTILSMIRIYFPVGSGLGGFDPIFRIHEPFDFLNSTYFNRAHDDFLEIAMEAGLPGILLVIGGLIWWAIASVRVWRAEPNGRIMRARLGSTIILLTAIASVVDYPARTPMMMAVLTLAACWLSDKGVPYGDSEPAAEEDHARRRHRRRSSSGQRSAR